MKPVKGIREDYNLITEKEEADVRKLTSLVHAGLFDSSKLPMIKRAMSKDPADLTLAERKSLLNLLDILMSEVLHSSGVYNKVKQDAMKKDLKEAKDHLSQYDPRVGAKWPSDKDMPMVIILKRKAIRVYPDQKKVALYYSQALDKYVTIPFGGDAMSVNESTIHLNEGTEPSSNNSIGAKKKKRDDLEDRLSKIPMKHLNRKGNENVSKEVTKLAVKKVATGSTGEKAGAAGFLAHKLVSGIASKFRKKSTSNKPLEGEVISPSKSKSPQITHNKEIEGTFKDVTPKPVEKKTQASLPAPTPKLSGPKPVEKSEPKVKPTKTIKAEPSTTTQQSTPAKTEVRPRQKMLKQKWRASMRESFNNKLNDKRMLKEYSKGEMAWDAATMIPVVGNALSAGEAVYKAAKGDYAGAAVAAAGAIPGAGQAVKAGKMAAKGGAALAKGALRSGEKEIAKDAIKIKPKPEPEVAAKGPKVEPGTAPEVKPSEPTPVKTEPKPNKPSEKVPDTEAPAPKVEPKPEAKPEPKAEPKVEPKVEPKPETKPAAKEGAGSKIKNFLKRGAGALAGTGFGGGSSSSSDGEEAQKFSTPGSFSLKASTSRASDFDANKTRIEKERQALYKEAFNVRLNNKPAPVSLAPKKEVPASPKVEPEKDDDEKSSTPTERAEPKEKTYSKPGEFSLKATTSNASKIQTDRSRSEKERQKMYSESVLKQLHNIKDGNLSEGIINIGSNNIVVNKSISEKVISVYESLNKENKTKLESMLQEDMESFKKIVNFAVRH